MNLLIEQVLTIEVAGEPTSASLAEALAALSTEDEVSFTALQAHQDHVWFMFLVQVAALALRPGDPVPRTAVGWAEALLELSGGEASAWQLQVDDIAKPAFLQPPDPSGEKDYSLGATTPDALDLLATAKNHDVKRQRVATPAAEHWVYALVSLQTSDGFLGAGNYGVARMNGGYGSRSLVSTARSLAWGVRFRDDLGVLRAQVDRLIDDYSYDPAGHALLWLLPWDGKRSLPRTALRPHFIEVCRRVRLKDGAAWTATSKTLRVDAKDDKGRVGDPWIPIRMKDGAALSVSERGFHRGLMTQLLRSGDWMAPACATALEAPHWWILQALARGQGGTDGMHQRFVPVPARARMAFGKQLRGETDLLDKQAETHDASATRMRNKVLYVVLGAVFSQGSDRPRHLMDAFEERVEAAFFPYLWRITDEGATRDSVTLEWDAYLAESALAVLVDAVATVLPEDRAPIERRGSGGLGGEDTGLSWVWKRAQNVVRMFPAVLRKQFKNLAEEGRMPRMSFPGAPPLESVRDFLSACRREHGGPTPGDLAALRRWEPGELPSMEAVKWAVVSGCDPEDERALAALQAVAFLFPQHDPKAQVGKALYEAGLSPMRLERLLSAPEDALPHQFRQVVLRLARAGTPVDVCRLADLLHHDDTRLRIRVAESFYRAEHHDSSGDSDA